MLEWSRTSPNTTYRGGPKVGDFHKHSVAECCGVQGRAPLTWRGGGLEKITLGPIWAAWKWRGDRARSARGPREGADHFGGPIERTRPQALTRAPHTAAMYARLTDDGLMSHGEAQGGSPQHAGLTANFRRACRDECCTIPTLYENALTPRKLFYFFISAPTRGTG